MLFESLTGFEVPFFDPGQVNAPQRSLQEAQALQFIIQVGQQLKHSGNPIEAMGNIIKSSYF
jgi:hypothetical protein